MSTRERALQRGVDDSDEWLLRRAQAEDEVLGRLERDADRATRAAARRLRLRRRIEDGAIPVGQRRAARDKLQRMRLSRPGGWRVKPAPGARRS